LATAAGLRRFSPREILRLLDFPEDYSLPPDMPREVAWRLVGNSVSVRAVRWVLSACGVGH
jgi:site-specific DNA-cytosine methylase